MRRAIALALALALGLLAWAPVQAGSFEARIEGVSVKGQSLVVDVALANTSGITQEVMWSDISLHWHGSPGLFGGTGVQVVSASSGHDNWDQAGIYVVSGSSVVVAETFGSSLMGSPLPEDFTLDVDLYGRTPIVLPVDVTRAQLKTILAAEYAAARQYQQQQNAQARSQARAAIHKAWGVLAYYLDWAKTATHGLPSALNGLASAVSETRQAYDQEMTDYRDEVRMTHAYRHLGPNAADGIANQADGVTNDYDGVLNRRDGFQNAYDGFAQDAHALSGAVTHFNSAWSALAQTVTSDGPTAGERLPVTHAYVLAQAAAGRAALGSAQRRYRSLLATEDTIVAQAKALSAKAQALARHQQQVAKR